MYTDFFFGFNLTHPVVPGQDVQRAPLTDDVQHVRVGGGVGDELVVDVVHCHHMHVHTLTSMASVQTTLHTKQCTIFILMSGTN